MRNRIIAAGVLAGGIALTGLAGSAYAAPAAKTAGAAKPAMAVKGVPKGAIAVICTGTRVKGKPEKGLSSMPEPARPGKKIEVYKRTGGRALLAPPPGAKAVKVTAKKGTAVVIKALKGVHCAQVKPGTPGAPPELPAR